MAQIIREISVDVAKANTFQAIVAKQYDSNSRFLKVTITNQDEAIDVAASSVVTINGIREDGQSAAFLGEVNDDGTVLVPLSNWLLALDGTVRCDISIVDADGRKLTTTMFSLNVEEAAYDGNDISDDPEDDLIVTLLNRCAEVEGYYKEVKAEMAGAVTGASSAVSGNVPVFDGTTGKIIKDGGHKLEADVPVNAKFTDTIYLHPTTPGNKHIPAGGEENQVLTWNNNGTAAWAESAPFATAFKYGDETISFTSFYTWFIAASEKTQATIDELKAEIAALEAQLNGISFGTDEDGRLTYEKEEAADENNG